MITFQNDDMVEDLAYIVENDVVQGAIDEQLVAAGDRVTVRHEAPVEDYIFPSSESNENESPWVQVKLKDGETISTRLVVRRILFNQCDEFYWGNIRYICIFYHFATLRWHR